MDHFYFHKWSEPSQHKRMRIEKQYITGTSEEQDVVAEKDLDHFLQLQDVESKKGDGRLSACEITLVQYEDLGMLGVRQGLCGTVKKLHNGLRAYQDARKSEAAVSSCAMMARITAKISSDVGTGTLERVSGEEEKCETNDIQGQRGGGGIKWK